MGYSDEPFSEPKHELKSRSKKLLISEGQERVVVWRQRYSFPSQRGTEVLESVTTETPKPQKGCFGVMCGGKGAVTAKRKQKQSMET